ncbi:MAG: hypothetical protein ABI912_10075, partial [Actinomycetota bacterium]
MNDVFADVSFRRVRAPGRIRGAVVVVVSLLLSLLSLAPAQAAPVAPVINMAATSTPASGDVVLAWLPVPGASQYKVEVSNSATFSVAYYTTGLTSALQATPTSSVPPGTWYWRVAAVDASGAGAWTVAPSFDRSSIAGPTGLTPGANGATTIHYPTAPVFTWNPVPDAESYTVEWSTSDTFPGGTLSGTTAASSFVPPTQLTRGQPWFWRVRGIMNGTHLPTDWSYALAGITIDWPNSAPTLLLPADDPPGFTPISDIELSWTPVDGAATYLVDVATDPLFSSASRLVGSPFKVYSTIYSPPRSYINGAYYWRVTAVDPNGNSGPPSGYRQFVRAWGPTSARNMTGVVVAAPTGLTPADVPHPSLPSAPPAPVLLTDDFELSWDAVPRATAYEVWLSWEPWATLFTDNSKMMKCTTADTHLTSFDAVASYPASWATTLQKFSTACFGLLSSGFNPTPGTPFRWRVRAIDLSASDLTTYTPPGPNNPIYSQWSDGDVVADAPRIFVNPGHSLSPAPG